MLRALRSIIGRSDTPGTRTIREDRLEQLLDQIDTLSRDVKSIRLEWAETEESVNRALRKLGKREKRAAEGDCGCGGGTTAQDGYPSSNGRPAGQLSPAEMGALLRAGRARGG